MKPKYQSYLLRIQYLGFRYSGWQKQPGEKTVEGMLTKTLKFVLPNQKSKVLGSGRTDAKVSALDMAFQLFIEGDVIENNAKFLDFFNENLPLDIRVVSISNINAPFNIIQSVKIKEYVYLFSYGKKNHPFCAPFMANIMGPLNIELMKKAAVLFVGTHNFSAFTGRLQINTVTVRSILSCEIRENKTLKANFFPEHSYELCTTGDGFMRYQIRMIMGALIQVGKGELSISDIKNSLQGENNLKLTYIAPGSGLILNQLEFE
jgi:tRNA pseudouridine38-40 synthase